MVGRDDPLLPPRFVLADTSVAVSGAPVPVRGGAARDGPAVVLLVGADDDAVLAARAARRAAAVLDWPTTPDALVGLLDHPVAPPARGAACTVAGAAGGVGATVVALGIAGIVAWRAGRTLVALTGPTHVDGAPRVTGADLASPAVWPAAARAPGLPALRVVGLTRPAGPVDVGTGVMPTVVELGLVDDHPVDVLVASPDRAGAAAVAAAAARAVVLVGRGPADGAVRAAAAGRPVVALRRDPRVGLACHAGRHPTDAPRSWLAGLDGLLGALGVGGPVLVGTAVDVTNPGAAPGLGWAEVGPGPAHRPPGGGS